ncbi:MAG: N-acetyltransferase family protein [Clostridiales bacterium]|nr:N-acetyltransferase family protein [Clostridiales bacterium]
MQRAIIRPAKPADYPAIRRILGYYIEHTTASWRYEVPGPSWIEQFDQSHQTPERPVFVAEVSGLIVGYSCLSDFRTYEGYWPCAENSVYVLPDYLGQQIGRALMTALLDAAAKTRLKKIIAAIDGDNQSSVRFHEQFGFKTCGELKDIGFKNDHWLSLILMELDLAEYLNAQQVQSPVHEC